MTKELRQGTFWVVKKKQIFHIDFVIEFIDLIHKDMYFKKKKIIKEIGRDADVI